MNILFATEYFPPYAPGGAEWSTLQLATSLASNGHNVSVATLNFGREPFQERKNQVNIFRLGFPFKIASGQKHVRGKLLANPIFYLYLTFRLWIIGRRIKADIVHAQNKQSLVPAYLAAKLLKIPVVFTIRDTGMICPITTCLVNERQIPLDCGLNKLVSGCSNFFIDNYVGKANRFKRIKVKLSLFYLWLDLKVKQWALKHCAAVLGVSQGILNIYPQRLFNTKQIIIPSYNLPSAVEKVSKLDIYKKYKLNPQKKLVLYAGKLSLGKGVFTFLAAARRFYLRGDKDVIFVFAGKHDIKFAGSPNCFFLGSIPHDDLMNLYLAAEAVVVPSIWPEPLSRVILEAMTLGKPVLGTKVGGTPECIVDGVTGLLVEPNNPEELTDTLAGLIRDDKLAKRLGKAAQERIHTYFDRDKTIAELLTIYKSIIHKRNRPLKKSKSIIF